MHPDNADALVFGSSILVESGNSARAEDWLARAIILAGMTTSFNTTRRSPTRCSAVRMLRWITLNGILPHPPPFDAAWRHRCEGPTIQEMAVLRGHPRFQALLVGLESDGAPPV